MNHEPTARSREQVQLLTGYGLNAKECARVLGLPVQVIERCYASELELGGLLATAKVAATVYRAATRKTKPSIPAAMFWLRTRGGWTATTTRQYVGVRDRARLLNETRTVEEGGDGWGGLLDGTAQLNGPEGEEVGDWDGQDDSEGTPDRTDGPKTPRSRKVEG